MRPERGPDADFPRALRHTVGQDAEQSYACYHQREHAERRQQNRVRPRTREARHDAILHRHDRINCQPRVQFTDRGTQRRHFRARLPRRPQHDDQRRSIQPGRHLAI